MASKSQLTAAIWIIGGTAAGIMLARALAPFADRVASRIRPAGVTGLAAGITPAAYRREQVQRRATATPGYGYTTYNPSDPYSGAMI